MQKAADVMPIGGTVHARGGTYAGFVVRRSGMPGDPNKFIAYPGEAVTIRGDSTRKSPIYIHDWRGEVTDITVKGFTIENAQGGFGKEGGIFVQNGGRILIRDNVIRNNKSFGIYLYQAYGVTVDANEITANEVGIYVVHEAQNSRFTNNRVHHNAAMSINTPDIALDDYGATGMAFSSTVGPVLVKGNRIWGHRAPSYDYDWDGSGLEIWKASGVEITENILWDNENVLETGSDGSAGCNGNQFTRNVAYGGAPPEGRSFGVLLRCAKDMLVANNTLYDFHMYVWLITHYTGAHGHSIEGLRFQNNISVAARTVDQAYSIGANIPASVQMDHNLAFNTSGGWIASVSGRGATKSLATMTSWTGLDAGSLQADPGFITGGAPLQIGADSPAVDRGRIIPGTTDGFVGVAPDIGRYEVGR